jgi:hypothetical protein
MNGQFQFSLRRLFFVITLLAVFLGAGKWCYIKYVDRIRPVTNESQLQLCIGKRVSFCGRYQHLGGNSSFQIVWLEKRRFPIAVAGTCADGSPLPQIPDGALIAVTGRLTDLPANATFPLPIERRGWVDKHLVYHKASGAQEFGYCPVCITAEEVRQVSE